MCEFRGDGICCSHFLLHRAPQVVALLQVEGVFLPTITHCLKIEYLLFGILLYLISIQIKAESSE